MIPESVTSGIKANAIYDVLITFIVRISLWVARSALRKSHIKPAELWLNHRQHTYDKYRSAFRSGTDVLLIATMSQSSLKEIEELLTQAKGAGTSVRVLTWAKDMPAPVVAAYSQHLDENKEDPSRSVTQLRDAVATWRRLESSFSNLEVREYRSSPTVQGIFVDHNYAMIELMPFGAHPRDRPALILDSRKDREIFSLLKKQYERLWDVSRQSGADFDESRL